MSISKYNSEGYNDPTAYNALSNVETMEQKATFKPLVFICSPYSGDVDTNVENARRYSRFAVNQKCIPLTPHLLYPQFLNDDSPSERELGLFFGTVLLGKCSEVWVFGNTISSGMSAEIAKAKRKNQTIRYFSDACEEVSR